MANWDEIRNEWETNKVTLAALAEKHDIKLGTLKSRKSREGWSRGSSKKDATKKKKVATIKPVIENDNLNDKQKMFCLYYIKYFNATKAYKKAYECSHQTADTNGPRLLGNARVKKEIERLNIERQSNMLLDAYAVLQKYIDIAFADITDFVEFGQKEQPEFNISNGEPLLDDDGEQLMYKYSFVNLRNADDVDGTIITEVKKGKDGVSIKLADKMKALEFLSKYTDLLSENDRKKLQEEKIKADISKVRSETKGTGNANISVVDFSNLSTEELRAIANSNKQTD